jgi:hypothetical protein
VENTSFFVDCRQQKTGIKVPDVRKNYFARVADRMRRMRFGLEEKVNSS